MGDSQYLQNSGPSRKPVLVGIHSRGEQPLDRSSCTHLSQGPENLACKMGQEVKQADGWAGPSPASRPLDSTICGDASSRPQSGHPHSPVSTQDPHRASPRQAQTRTRVEDTFSLYRGSRHQPTSPLLGGGSATEGETQHKEEQTHGTGTR